MQKVLRVLFLAFCGIVSSAEALTLTSIEPSLARPGDSVAIGVEGVVPSGSYEVRIGGVSAQITQTGTNSLTIMIPPGAETATMEVKELPDGPSVQSLFPFRILMPVTVRVSTNTPVQLADYTGATLFSSASLASGEAQLDVLAGKATPVFAAPANGTPFLLAVVTDPSEVVEFSARGTAEALVFTAGPIFIEDPAAARERLAQLDGFGGIDEAEAIITSNLLAGQDFSHDPRLPEALGLAATELRDLLEAAQQPASPKPPPTLAGLRDDTYNGTFDFTTNSPRDLEAETQFRIFNTLDTTQQELSVSSGGLPIRFLRFAPSSANGVVRANPLDWLANLYELDPGQFRFGQAEVDQQYDDYTSVYDRVQPHVASGVVQARPVGRLLIPASGLTDKLFKGTVAGTLDAIKASVVDAIFPPSPTPTKLAVPLNKPAIYIARIYSGSLYTPQDNLLTNLPEGLELKAAMLQENLMQMGLDSLSQLPTHFNSALDVAFSALKNLEKEIARKQASAQELSSKEVEILLNELRREGLKKVLATSESKVVGNVGGTVLKIQSAMFAIAGLDERLRALTDGAECSTGQCNNLTARQTVETALIVVGDPFSPRITSFEPQRGHHGRVVTLHGIRFSSILTNNIVEFVSESTTPARAEVLAASATQLTVVVPDDAAEGKHALHLKIRVVDSAQIRGETDTTSLEAPFDGFDVVDDPMISGLDPNPVRVSAPMVIHGTNFGSDYLRVRVEVDGFTSMPLRLSEDQITVRAPFTAGSHVVRVGIEQPLSGVKRDSNEFAFETVPGTGQPGASIFVNSLADNTDADSFVTLREAMIWASGSEAIHEPTPSEAQHIIGEFGPGLADQILCQGGLFAVVAELPPLTAYDRLNPLEQDCTIDGAGLPVDALHIVGERATLYGKFQNFGGSGVVLDGATFCQALNVRVENVGGDGFAFRNGSQFNTLAGPSATGCGSNGFHLTGSDVAFNDFRLIVPARTGDFLANSAASSNGAWGILVEGGAHDNHIELLDVVGNTLGGIGFLDSTSTNNTTIASELDQDQHVIRPFMNVSGNGGPGVHSVASGTAIHEVRAAGNAGDGILIEGGVSNCVIDNVRIGFDKDRKRNGNKGNGIHLKNVRHSSIGLETGRATFFDSADGTFPQTVIVGGNRDHGIFLENSADIRLQSAWIGVNGPMNETVIYPDGGNITDTVLREDALMPDGLDGIRLLDCSGCTIGDNRVKYAVGVVGETNGAGIMLAGQDTFDNRVFGTTVGALRAIVPTSELPGSGAQISKVDVIKDTFDVINGIFVNPNTLGNRNGIIITDGAWGNVIGQRGVRQEILDTQTFPPDTVIVDAFISDVVIVGNLEAGITIESGIDPRADIGPETVPSGGNVVQNCYIGETSRLAVAPNETGLILRGNARANRIGGTDPSEQNRLIDNLKVGILVNGVQVGQANLANRIIGNLIGLNYTPANKNDRPENFLTQPPLGGTGIGILVTNSVNQPIGGANPGEGNDLFSNGTGVYIINSSGITVSGNEIGADRESQSNLGNRAAGVVLNGCQNCTIGPGNFLLANGRAYTPPLLGSAAITLHAGSDNRVFGNFIGLTPDKSAVLGNYDGIVLDDSPRNTIGGAADGEGNVIVDSDKNGIVIQGAQSIGNFVGGNDVGSVPDKALGIPGRPAGVGECGILLQNGASTNSIGQAQVAKAGNRLILPAENRVYYSGQAGIRVDGAATLGNALLFNSISENTGLGIETVAGGNTQLPPPTVTMFSGGTIFGTVDDTLVPKGSLVQVYSDADEEGFSYEGQGPVIGGAFEIFIGTPLKEQIKATVTDLNGNTSEFGGTSVQFTAGLKLARVGPPLDRNASVGATGIVAAVLSIESLNAPIEVHSVEFHSSGDIEAATNVTALKFYLDTDRDGALSEGDILLGEAEGFDPANGLAVVNLDGALLGSLEEQQWILTFDLSDAAPVGAVFKADVGQSSDVVATTIIPQTLVALASGAFPVSADHFTISALATELPALQLAIQDGAVVISWTGVAVLQQAPSVNGPWQDMAAAASPYTVVPDEMMSFFRLKSN